MATNQRYWVMGSGEPIGIGFKSIVDARKRAVKLLAENKAHSVTAQGYLTIVQASNEPYRHLHNYKVVGYISKSNMPGVYTYQEYTGSLYYPKTTDKKVSPKGTIIRG